MIKVVLAYRRAFLLSFLLVNFLLVNAQTYTTIANGNWNTAATWQGGSIPPTAGTIPSTAIINIRHTVAYNTGNNIDNDGTIRIQPITSTTARLDVPTGINLNNFSNGKVYVINGSYVQFRFVPGNDGQPYSGNAPGAALQSGTFKNTGGFVQLLNGYVEIAQDWVNESNGIRVCKNSCIKTGQNFSLSGAASIDTLMGVNLTIGWHSSGNYQANDGTTRFQQTRIQLAGTSGSFQLNSGTATGDIDYINLRNNIVPFNGGGNIFASASLIVTGGLNLDAYCSPGGFTSNGKFSGTQTSNCTLNYFPGDCPAGGAAPTVSINLSLTKSVNIAGCFVNGDTRIFTLTATNTDDNFSATSVVVNDLLPAGLTFVSSSGDGTYISGSGVWSIGTMAPGQIKTRTITATATGTTDLVNTANVGTLSQPDPDLTNNTSSITLFATPAIPTVASTTQPTCTIPTGTIVFNTQAGVEYGVNGVYQASPTFSGLTAGIKTLTVRSITNNACINTAATTVTVSPAGPCPPVANDDIVATPLTEDGANGTVSILTNDTDPEGNPTPPTNGGGQFTVDLDVVTGGLQTSFTNATGVWTYNTATGVVTFDPANDYNGTATITYTLCDPTALCDNALITFTVTPVNDAPVAVNDSQSTSEDAPVTFSLTANDTDVDGTVNVASVDLDPATVGIQTTFTNASGNFSVNALGNVTYTPALNFNGTATVTYTVNDNNASASNIASVSITVNSVNDEPSFTKGADQTVNEDAGAQTAATWATAISKGATNESAQTLTFNVTNNNNALFSVQPSIDPTTGNLAYTPAANMNGLATVTVILTDNGGVANGGDDTFATQTFTITVNSVNDEPTFTKGADQTVNEDAGAQTIAAWATAINKGAANESAQTLTFNTTNNNNALFSVQPSIDPTTGNLTYTPAANASGIATVTVILTDNGGVANGGDDTFATQTFTITVNPVNDEPTFVKGADQTVNEDAGAQTVTTWATAINKGAANESAQTLTFNTTNNNNALFSVQPSIDPTTGSLTYTPAADMNGVATVTVILTDNGGVANGGDDTFATQTFTITVSPVNDEPTFVKGADQTVNEDAGVQTVTAWATSINKGAANESAQVLTFNITNNNNALFSLQPSIDPATGNLTYTPAANTSGVATVTVILTDNGGVANGGDDTFATQTFTITVNPVNDAPVAVNDTPSATGQNTTVVFNVTMNDTDTDGTIATSTVDLDPTAPGIQNTITNASGGWTVDALGNITYIPALNFTGPASVTYTVNDNTGATSNVATVGLTVNATNTPVAVNDTPSATNEEVATTFSVTANDTDTDGTISIGTVDLDVVTPGVQNTVTNASGVWTANAGGNVVFTPAANFNGLATVTYTVQDNSGATSNIATVSLTVNSVNDEPTFVKGADQIVNEDAGAQTVATWASSINKGAANESAQTLTMNVTNNNNALFSVQPNVDPTTGNLTYTPAANAFGSVTVMVILTDNGGVANGGDDTFTTQTFTITVNPVNDPPVAVNDTPTATIQNTTVVFNVTGNDTDVDGTIATSTVDLDPATAGIQNTISNTSGTWTVDALGNITYVPTTNFAGAASVNYTVNDNTGATSNIATVNITVNPAGTPVAMNDGPPATNEDIPTTFNVTGNDTDSDGTIAPNTVDLDPTTAGIQNTITNASGLWSVDGLGNVTLTPALNFNGPASVTYVVKDNAGITSNVARVDLTVNPVNDPPVLTNLNPSVNINTPFSGSVFVGSDLDPDGTALTVTTTPVSGPTNGSITISQDGTYTYAPASGFTGTDVVIISICDSGLPLPAACTNKTITFAVVGPTSPPTANPATVSLPENSSINTPVHTVVATDADANDVLTYSILEGNTGNAFQIDPQTGAISVSNVAPIDFEVNPIFTINVLVTDRQGNTTTAIITINLVNTNNEDTDKDGVLDSEEDINIDDNVLNDDGDGDGIPDFKDTDDDNDGLPTAEEDANGDGDFFNDDCDADDTPDFRDDDQCKLRPELGFSPSGDGINETWVIVDIERYPNNSVKVFNRWGNMVFETKGYNNHDNSWAGQSNGKLTLGSLDVPDGSYFYVIDLGDGSKPIGGYVFIKR
jgi:gliding motility-associated-like protein